MIKVKVKTGRKTERFLKRLKSQSYLEGLDAWGRKGVEALSLATPRDTGKTAESWNYEIHHGEGETFIYWTNNNVNRGVPVAALIQYGHATKNGGFVKGIDYINPAMEKIFDEIADDTWKEVTKE